LLENIIRNAWKFTSKRADAHIEFGVVEGAGSPVCYLRDNGMGFDMAKAERLLNHLNGYTPIRKFPVQASALLSWTALLKKQGGKIWAEGEVGKGATIYFALVTNRSDSCFSG